MRSSSMILRKWRTEKPASPAALGCKNAARKTIRRSAIDRGQDLRPLVLGIDIQRHNRTKELFTHRAIIRPFDLDDCRPNEIPHTVVGFAAGDNFGIAGPACF